MDFNRSLSKNSFSQKEEHKLLEINKSISEDGLKIVKDISENIIDTALLNSVKKGSSDEIVLDDQNEGRILNEFPNENNKEDLFILDKPELRKTGSETNFWFKLEHNKKLIPEVCVSDKKECEWGIQECSKTKLEQLNSVKNGISELCTKFIETANKLFNKIGVASENIKTEHHLIKKWLKMTTYLINQISDVRLELKMLDKMHSMNNRRLKDLGDDGLRMIDSEPLRAEAQSLQDKIEERNTELSKLRYRCNSNNNILSHIREKQYILGNTIILQESVLNDLIKDQSLYRNHLNSIKLERDKLRKEFKEISFECGLLDKPALLRDYDDTVMRIERSKQNIDQLKMKQEKIKKDLDNVMGQLGTKLLHASDSQQFDEMLQKQLDDMEKPPYPRILRGIQPVRNFNLNYWRTN